MIIDIICSLMFFGITVFFIYYDHKIKNIYRKNVPEEVDMFNDSEIDEAIEAFQANGDIALEKSLMRAGRWLLIIVIYFVISFFINNFNKDVNFLEDNKIIITIGYCCFIGILALGRYCTSIRQKAEINKIIEILKRKEGNVACSQEN